MPLFDYTCQDCGNESELLVTSDQQPTCPNCGSMGLSKLLPLVASPARETNSKSRPDSSPGPCGSACGCYPHG